MATVTVEGETVVDNPALGLDAAAVRERLLLLLRESGRFTEPPQSAAAERGARLTLELGYTRESVRKPREGMWAETGAQLDVEIPLEDGSIHEEVVGVGEAPIQDASLEARRAALRRALDDALLQVVASADLMLRARTRTDAELAAQLKDPDARVVESALRVLAERKSPLAVDALLERLHLSDAAKVRRAMGALVEMREPRAVPALIELGRNKEPPFFKEIVFALGEIGGEEAEAWLFTVSQGHDVPAVREAASRALGDLRAQPRR
ncbi:MAG: HEAT repeat domain-containing protein [Deltaproteobacteria bacterium]|nr:HEAT repeat domain-containing protein [Deltaproteobacteria bacterium]